MVPRGKPRIAGEPCAERSQPCALRNVDVLHPFPKDLQGFRETVSGTPTVPWRHLGHPEKLTTSIWKHLEGLWRHPGAPRGTWEAPRRSQEAARRQPGSTQEAPRSYPGGTQEAPGSTKGTRGIFEVRCAKTFSLSVQSGAVVRQICGSAVMR